MLDEESGGGAAGVIKQPRAFRGAGLLEVILCRSKSAAGKEFAEVLLGLRHDCERTPGDLSHALACQVILRRPQSAADQYGIASRKSQLECRCYTIEVVANRMPEMYVYPYFGQPLRHVRGIGVDYLPEQ
jgi:hypothetical protein